MTEQALKRGQELKREIDMLNDCIESFDKANQAGVCIVFPNDGKLLEDIKKIVIERLRKLNEQFSKL